MFKRHCYFFEKGKYGGKWSKKHYFFQETMRILLI